MKLKGGITHIYFNLIISEDFLIYVSFKILTSFTVCLQAVAANVWDAIFRSRVKDAEKCLIWFS